MYGRIVERERKRSDLGPLNIFYTTSETKSHIYTRYIPIPAAVALHYNLYEHVFFHPREKGVRACILQLFTSYPSVKKVQYRS